VNEDGYACKPNGHCICLGTEMHISPTGIALLVVLGVHVNRTRIAHWGVLSVAGVFLGFLLVVRLVFCVFSGSFDMPVFCVGVICF
jgi:hypothetical protein